MVSRACSAKEKFAPLPCELNAELHKRAQDVFARSWATIGEAMILGHLIADGASEKADYKALANKIRPHWNRVKEQSSGWCGRDIRGLMMKQVTDEVGKVLLKG